MKSSGYESMEHFEKDHNKVCESPNNMQLINAVQKRVNATEPALRREIVDKLLDEMLETNPMAAFQVVMEREENRDKLLVIKSSTDPWFEC